MAPPRSRKYAFDLPRRAGVKAILKGRPSADAMWFRGKTAVITGASSGIGRSCARLLAREGATLVLTARRAAALDVTAQGFARVRNLPADLADPRSLKGFCDKVLQESASLDLVIHCAGVGLHAPADATEPDQARRLMALNLLAPVEITRRLRPAMAAGSLIVMVSSLAGRIALPGMAVYSASKHALKAYGNALRAELRESGTDVLEVCPALVNTPFGVNMLQGSTAGPLPSADRLGISADHCAAAILEGVRKGKRTVVVPRYAWLLIAADRICPAATRAWMLRWTGRFNAV